MYHVTRTPHVFICLYDLRVHRTTDLDPIPCLIPPRAHRITCYRIIRYIGTLPAFIEFIKSPVTVTSFAFLGKPVCLRRGYAFFAHLVTVYVQDRIVIALISLGGLLNFILRETEKIIQMSLEDMLI